MSIHKTGVEDETHAREVEHGTYAGPKGLRERSVHHRPFPPSVGALLAQTARLGLASSCSDILAFFFPCLEGDLRGWLGLWPEGGEEGAHICHLSSRPRSIHLGLIRVRRASHLRASD